MNRKKELLKNTVVIGIGNIFTKAISFLLVPLFTLWLTTRQYGDYDLLYSYISLIVPAITLQLEQAVLRFTLDEKEKGPEYFHICASIVLVNSFIIAIIFCAVCKFDYHIPFAFCSISYAMETYCAEYLRGCNELRLYSLMNVTCGICTLFFSFIFVKMLGGGVAGLLNAFGYSYLVTALYIFLKKKLYRGVFRDCSSGSRLVLKTLLLYSLPLLPNAVSWWVTNVSDRTLIRIFLGSHYNGLYAVSCKIPSLVTVFYGIFNLAWQQSAILTAKDQEDKRKVFYNDIFKRLQAFLFSGGLVVIAATPVIYRLFLKADYMDGMNVVPILIWATSLLNLAQYLGGILLAQKDTKTNGTTTVAAAIINLLIDIIFIRTIGLYAAAISTLASYAVMLYLRLTRLKGYFDVKTNMLNILSGSAALVIGAVVMANVKHFIPQCLFLFLSLIIFFAMNRKVMGNIIGKLKGR